MLEHPLLVVEDQRALAMMEAAMLHERWGCEVHIAGSLARVHELLATGTEYFAASCDLNLPDAPDGEVVDVLVAAGIPTIAITATFGGEMRAAMLQKGVVDYVLKNSTNAYAYVAELIGFVRKNRDVKVLIADDDAEVHRQAESIFRRYRMQVLHADDGEQALALAEANPDIRLALIDYHMPKLDGMRLAIALRQRCSKERLAIIGMSSTHDNMLAAEFLKNGANDFIAKPFEFEELVCRTNQNLEMLYLVEENRNAAFRDYLTGLPNRRAFFAEGPQRLGRAKDRPQAVAMLDIDFFKKINDTYGHDAGDEALTHVAAILEQAFSGRLIARLGGEEFGVVLDGLDGNAAIQVADAARKQLESTPLLWDGASLQVTTSVGIGVAKEETGLDELLATADKNLYTAKESGRNRVVLL